jgi:F1F0 ATPase subunit 2
MIMNEPIMLIISAAAGGALGTLFFAGLWFTVRKGLESDRPALWFLGSTLVRTGLLLTSFYVIGRGNWHYLLACLLGFFGARIVVTVILRTKRRNTCG